MLPRKGSSATNASKVVLQRFNSEGKLNAAKRIRHGSWSM
jgi:hypothetical protein